MAGRALAATTSRWIPRRSRRRDGALEIDFVAPDRSAWSRRWARRYIVGDTMYMSTQGRTMKMPMPKGTPRNAADPAKLQQSTRGDDGAGPGRETSTAGRRANTGPHHPAQAERSRRCGSTADGLPVQVEVVGKGPNKAKKTDHPLLALQRPDHPDRSAETGVRAWRGCFNLGARPRCALKPPRGRPGARRRFCFEASCRVPLARGGAANV